jgi:hypothetical protein
MAVIAGEPRPFGACDVETAERTIEPDRRFAATF